MDNAFTFFDSLKKINAIKDIWKYVLIMLKNQHNASDDVLKFLCLFFALIDDENLCIPLDAAKLKEKWNNKLAGLDTQGTVIDYDAIIEAGIRAIKNCSADNSLVVEYNGINNTRADNLFVIQNGWLFTEKFFHAKSDIEEAITSLFPATSTDKGTITADIKQIQNKYNYRSKNSKVFEICTEQAAAIARAKKGESLIITGGPGTGKTTVICYLLLELLADNATCPIYMAAPSGKAAKRMQESIKRSVASLNPSVKEQHTEACKKIDMVKPVTLHKLLGLSGTITHQTIKFPANSIFVIDEASMIDAVLFAKLLNVIKQSDNAHLFLLGDKDQLPSVQAGAVFSDLTEKRTDCLIKLTKTHRFPENSEIYKLKEYVRNPENAPAVQPIWEENVPGKWQEELKSNQGSNAEYPVKYITISGQAEVQNALRNWYDAFYNNDEYKKIYEGLDLNSADIKETLDKIWKRTEQAKILCAENHGMQGTENINKLICDYIKAQQHLDSNSNEQFFVGKQVIVTKNQHLYDLSNGDIGIIVSLDNKQYIMIKREKETTESRNHSGLELIRSKCNYIFYPVYLLPSDSIEPAYAITIHKSQGSEYDNILIFLPEAEKSPLLNRQILYTAITRTKKATYIVSNKTNLEKAIKTVKKRETQLFL